MRQTQHVPALDGVRGLAILLVVLFHAFGLRLGAYGVDLFFVLSGYLIAGILLDQREAGNLFTVFYARRAMRILPIYAIWLIAFIALSAALQPSLGTPRFDNLGEILPLATYFTFTQNIAVATQGTFGAQWMGPTWSLAVEEQFYLLLPFLVRTLDRRNLLRLTCAAIALAPLCRLVAVKFLSPVAHVLLPCRMDSLAWGIALALADRDSRLKIRWFFLAGIPLALLDNFSLAAVLSAVAVAAASRVPVLSKGLLPSLGEITFGLYIIHQGVNHLLHDLILHARPSTSTPPAIAITLASVAISLLLATLSWKALEKPLTAWGRRRFRYGPPIAAAPAAEYALP